MPHGNNVSINLFWNVNKFFNKILCESEVQEINVWFVFYCFKKCFFHGARAIYLHLFVSYNVNKYHLRFLNS